MCKIIAITNQKGGCSKTTSTVNIGIGLARAGKSVLLIDADAQGSLTASLGFKRPDEIGITLATIMAKTINEEDIELKRAILKHEEGVDLIPGNIELSGLEVQLSNVLSRELILKEFVDSIREEYEYILIDCAPSLGMMTINALVAADEVIIPVQAAYLPVKGLQQLIKTINMVKRRLNKKLQVGGILLAMVDYRTNYAKNISAQLYEALIADHCKNGFDEDAKRKIREISGLKERLEKNENTGFAKRMKACYIYLENENCLHNVEVGERRKDDKSDEKINDMMQGRAKRKKSVLGRLYDKKCEVAKKWGKSLPKDFYSQ